MICHLKCSIHFHFSLSCIGEGNGNPLQYSCLENPRDGGAWWAAVYGVAQSRTRLKRLSSSSSIQWFSVYSQGVQTSVPPNSRTSPSPQRRPCTHWQPLPNSSPSSLWWTLNPFLSLWICLLWTFHTNGMVQHAAFCVRLLLLNIMFSRFLHIVSCISTSLLLMTDSIVWIFHNFVYLSIN